MALLAKIRDGIIVNFFQLTFAPDNHPPILIHRTSNATSLNVLSLIPVQAHCFFADDNANYCLFTIIFNHLTG